METSHVVLGVIQIDTPLPGGSGDFHSSFPGLSQIIDSDGNVRAQIKAEEGVIVAEVTLSPKRKRLQRLRCYNKMRAFPMPWYASPWPQTQRMGEADYVENPRRWQAAIAASSTIPVEESKPGIRKLPAPKPTLPGT